jgi:hypothetical protein
MVNLRFELAEHHETKRGGGKSELAAWIEGAAHSRRLEATVMPNV